MTTESNAFTAIDITKLIAVVGGEGNGQAAPAAAGVDVRALTNKCLYGMGPVTGALGGASVVQQGCATAVADQVVRNGQPAPAWFYTAGQRHDK